MSTEVFHVNSNEELKRIFDKSKKYNIKVFMKFGAKWCKPCKTIEPIYDQLSLIYSHCIFLSIDVDNINLIKVKSLPTFSLLKDGQYRELFSGADQKLLIRYVQNENQ
jgi:thioredoxin 1